MNRTNVKRVRGESLAVALSLTLLACGVDDGDGGALSCPDGTTAGPAWEVESNQRCIKDEWFLRIPTETPSVAHGLALRPYDGLTVLYHTNMGACGQVPEEWDELGARVVHVDGLDESEDLPYPATFRSINERIGYPPDSLVGGFYEAMAADEDGYALVGTTRQANASATDVSWQGGDAFVSREGPAFWTWTLGERDNHDGAHGIASAGNGELVIVGETRSDLDPAIPPFAVREGEGADLFVARLRGSVPSWTRQIQSQEYERGEEVAIAPDGHIVVAGERTGDFGPHSHETLRETDSVVYMLDEGGRVLWSASIASDARDTVGGVAIDSDLNTYVIGTTQGAIGDGTLSGESDVFVGKIDRDGNVVWTRQLGSPYADHGHGVTVNDLGDVFITGASEVDGAFVQRLSPEGDVMWTRSLEMWGVAAACAIISVGDERLYIAGTTGRRFGQTNAIVAKLTQSGPAL